MKYRPGRYVRTRDGAYRDRLTGRFVKRATWERSRRAIRAWLEKQELRPLNRAARMLGGRVEMHDIEGVRATAIVDIDATWPDLADALRVAQGDPRLSAARLHVRAEYMSEEGWDGWSSLSYAVGDDVAVEQAAWKAEEFGQRYKDARARTLGFVPLPVSGGREQRKAGSRARSRERQKLKGHRGRGPK